VALLILELVGGLVVLSVGGECLVRGAARLARSLGVSALAVGLTIVAFGTSAPEIAVSISAGVQQHDDLAIANVVGSCILNTLVVLGLAAVTRPLRVSRSVVRTDAPFMILVLALFTFFAVDDVGLLAGGKNNGLIGYWEGILFIAGLIAYVALTYHGARRQPQVVEAEYEQSIGPVRASAVNVMLVLVGLVGLVFGADLMVEGGTGIARSVGISERIIGLTIFAIGTSLPEVATCVIAARRGQPDIAVGNVVGSNIFNVLAVIGIATTAHPAGALTVNWTILSHDVPVMLVAAVLLFPILRTGRHISRREGTLLLALYVGYLTWALLATQTGATVASAPAR
jgi:cation:H+ antiporter